jgi:hypothetical protein
MHLDVTAHRGCQLVARMVDGSLPSPPACARRLHLLERGVEVCAGWAKAVLL